MKLDEHAYLKDDYLAKEAKWLEEEKFYNEQIEKNKKLPAVIKVVIPNFKIKQHENNENTKNIIIDNNIP